MQIVIDTNILVNALKARSSQAKSVRLMEDVFAGKYTICMSSAIRREYTEVLHRPQLGIAPSDADAFLALIDRHAYYIEPLPTSATQVPMRDEKDRIFFDVAKSLNVKLITRNYRDYPVHELITLIDELY